MKSSTKVTSLLLLAAVLTTPAWAVSDNASQAGKHSAMALAHTGVATTKVVSAVAAAPLVVIGELGKAAGEAGDSMMGYALEDEPLEISDDTVIADPAPRHVNARKQQEI